MLGKYVQHGGIFSLPELNKLHNLSLENEEFKAIYTFYMDEKLDINTIDEHTNLVRET
ncbi:MAG: hypothetical protein LBO09_04180 [Candidatus Peribacteria bacterium]|nr:hypothetical protein [Candidatus Peribacteria bacterium]